MSYWSTALILIIKNIMF